MNRAARLPGEEGPVSAHLRGRKGGCGPTANRINNAPLFAEEGGRESRLIYTNAMGKEEPIKPNLIL